MDCDGDFVVPGVDLVDNADVAVVTQDGVAVQSRTADLAYVAHTLITFSSFIRVFIACYPSIACSGGVSNDHLANKCDP